MSLYRKAIWPLLRHAEAENVHDRTLAALEKAQGSAAGRWALRRISGRLPPKRVSVFGRDFSNPLGMAAGFDKDARVASGLAALGFGHVEVGTLTPRRQPGSPKPRIFRLPEDGALINRLGFPNCGVEEALPRLRALADRDFILGVSLGKQKETPLEEAARDYRQVMQRVYRHVDYLAVNISSPNTPELRKLQGRAYLDGLVARLVETSSVLASELGIRQRPLLFKIAPDLETGELEALLETFENHGVSGVIAVNTTVRREGLRGPQRVEAGGLSGEPLRLRSTDLIAEIHRLTRGRLPIIGVGGVRTAADVIEKLEAGASLVQIYTALVYEGPGLPGRLLRGLGERAVGETRRRG